MNKYRISIIVPIHGVEKYLFKCLNSLLNQDIKEKYEVICVNDKPNDNSPLIIDEFINKYPNIFKRIDVNNGNVSKTRNDGLKVSSGEYITFVDGDDFVKENYLSNFFNLATKKKADIVVSSYYIFKNNKTYKHLQTTLPINGNLNKKRAIKLLIDDIFIRGFVWNKFFKKELLKDASFLDINKVFEDAAFSFYSFLKAKNIYISSKRTYFYLVRENSYSHNWDYYRYLQMSLNLLAYYKFLYKKEENEKFKFSLFIKKINFFFIVAMIKTDKKTKKIIKNNVKNQLNLIKNHFVYKNTPWEKLIKEAKLDDIKEDINFINLNDSIFDMLKK